MNSTKKPNSDKIDRLWVNVHLATMAESTPYGTIENGALAVGGEKIAWIGKRNELPADLESGAIEVHDGQGGWMTPGLVDCHTHLVYGGSRAHEFELRLQGATYEEIARQGGGIRSTVSATRQADEDSLLKQSAPRLAALMHEGVTTVEKVPPIDLLRQYAVPMALSTDCNPGSSPAVSLLLMLNMACTLFRLTPEEALAGVTRNGARALGLQDQIGTLEQGKDADFVVWDIPEPAELAYRIGANPLRYVVRKGKLVRSR